MKVSDESKEQLIRKCALVEFGEHGYSKASTNRIIKSAATSKGILFHYFKSKKNLFLTVLDQGMETFERYYKNELKEMPSDLLERYGMLCSVKVKMFIEYPHIYKIVSDSFRDCPDELYDEISERKEKMKKFHEEFILKNVDYSLFSNEYEWSKILQFISSVLETLTQNYMESFQKLPDRGLSKLPEVMKEFEVYLSMLRGGVYK